jgi:DNA mismatch repair protein MutS
MQPVDRHTLHELQILPENSRATSIFDFFNETETQGGADHLKAIIVKPKKTLAEVTQTQKLLKRITSDPAAWRISISKSYVAAIESYYTLSVAHSMSQDVFKHWLDTLIYSFRNAAEYYRIQSGVLATLRLVRAVQLTLTRITDTEDIDELAEDLAEVRKFVLSKALTLSLRKKDESLSNASIFYLDYHFRVKYKEQFRQMLDTVYRLDALLAVVKTAGMQGLTLPVFSDNPGEFRLERAWHPLIANAVANDFHLPENKSACILTGANTSGKTTFLKTCGVIVYLAHLGWPVPAKSLHLPFLDRLFTSIHLSDDLNAGFSHFFNEMMRIKSTAEALQQGEKCFVIIDELFRGTNQEDALHCSKTVMDGFPQFGGSYFLVSTHLHELIDHYRRHSGISLQCFKTRISGKQFNNTFQIEPGAAFEKVGRLIMDQTGVTALLTNAKRPSTH